MFDDDMMHRMTASPKPDADMDNPNTAIFEARDVDASDDSGGHHAGLTTATPARCKRFIACGEDSSAAWSEVPRDAEAKVPHFTDIADPCSLNTETCSLSTSFTHSAPGDGSLSTLNAQTLPDADHSEISGHVHEIPFPLSSSQTPLPGTTSRRLPALRIDLPNTSMRLMPATKHDAMGDASPPGYLSPVSDGSGSDRKSTRLNSSHSGESRMPSSA